jgi:hypothetical protein
MSEISSEIYEAPQTIMRMLALSQSLLYTLTPGLRRQAEFPMDDPSRLDWDFIPKSDRKGVPIAVLDRHQRTIAQTLIRSALSMRGYTKALGIMAMENVLRELEADRHGVIAGDFRSQDLYFLSFYGRPSFEETWSWRLLGHHLSLCYTIVGQRYLTVTPCNMGAQPASAGALAPLAEDEDLGFQLLHSLDDRRRSQAVIHSVAPADYATRQVPFIGKVEYPDYIDLGIPWYRLTEADREALKFVKDEPRGVAGSDLTTAQAATLTDLVHCYLDRMPEEVAAGYKRRLGAEGLDKIYFCWAGGLDYGTSHYYRVQTSQLLIEFDNAIDNGNHIHSMWRDYRNDLGHDLLLDHYEKERETGHHLRTRLESSVPDE